MGDHCQKNVMLLKNGNPVDEIPFGKTIEKIEQIREEIDDLRKTSSKQATYSDQLLDLEDKLRSAYAELAAKASNKVATWQKGPKK